MSVPLVVRADGGKAQGLGHVTRSAALARCWAGRGPVTWVTTCEEQRLLEDVVGDSRVIRLGRPHPHSEDVEETLAVLEDGFSSTGDPGWLALDGYHFDAGYVARVRSAGHRVVQIDDLAAWDRYEAEVLVNQNIDAERLEYSAAGHCELLLGPRYALLHSAFAAQRAALEAGPRERDTLLITLGGADPRGATLTVVRALRGVSLEGVRVEVLVGPANPQLAAISEAAEELGFSVLSQSGPRAVAGAMAGARAAISAAGSTCWELACLGVPAIVVVAADNQQRTARGLERIGFVTSLGGYESLSETRLREAVQTLLEDRGGREQRAMIGRRLVDAQGARRVVMRMTGEPIRLREATAEDAGLLFGWANESDVRRAAFQQRQIGWEEHLEWLRDRLSRPGTRIYVAEDAQDQPVGQIRFDRQGTRAEISFSVAHGHRGAGLGTALLRLGTWRYGEEFPGTEVVGRVKGWNRPSIGAFESCGFIRWEGGGKDGAEQILAFRRLPESRGEER